MRGRTFVLPYPNLHAFCVNGTVSGVLGSPDELWMAAQCLNWVSVRGSLEKKKKVWFVRRLQIAGCGSA
jgi:hypothetical protein